MVVWIFIKKWWKYLLIILGAILVLLYYMFLKKSNPASPVNISTKLQEGLVEVKEKLQEASNQAVIETVVAKQKHVEVKQKLKEVAKIKDNSERRKRLAELAKRR